MTPGWRSFLLAHGCLNGRTHAVADEELRAALRLAGELPWPRDRHKCPSSRYSRWYGDGVAPRCPTGIAALLAPLQAGRLRSQLSCAFWRRVVRLGLRRGGKWPCPFGASPPPQENLGTASHSIPLPIFYSLFTIQRKCPGSTWLTRALGINRMLFDAYLPSVISNSARRFRARLARESFGTAGWDSPMLLVAIRPASIPAAFM